MPARVAPLDESLMPARQSGPSLRSHVTLALCTLLHAFTHAYGTILVPHPENGFSSETVSPAVREAIDLALCVPGIAAVLCALARFSWVSSLGSMIAFLASATSTARTQR